MYQWQIQGGWGAQGARASPFCPGEKKLDLHGNGGTRKVTYIMELANQS